MDKSATEVLFKIAMCMSRGEIHRLQRYFRFPYPVYYGDDVRIVCNPDDAASGTAEYMADLAKCGVEKVAVASAETLANSDERCYLRVIWNYENARGTVLAATQNDVYFQCAENGQPKICQLDIKVSSNEHMRKHFKVNEAVFDA